jgi:glycosyltransferase involved in cell wall biosynthesis
MSSTPTQPLVSIIVPNYNHARFLPERLSSIRNQTLKDYELIILDDASTDESLIVIRAELADFPHQVIINARNSGSPCSQWLKGIQQARGRYVWIAESDDSCSPDFLASMMDLMNQGSSLVYSKSLAVDQNSNPLPETPYWPSQHFPSQWEQSFQVPVKAFCQSYMLKTNCIPNASAVVFQRKSALNCLDLENLLVGKLYTGDWIFWIHLLRHLSGTVAYSSAELSFFRHHHASTRSVSDSKNSDRRRITEYCQCVDWILAQKISPGKIPWLRHTLGRDWEWIIVEYLWRLKPSYFERFTAKGLSGALAWSLPIRLYTRSHLRRLFLSVGLA